MLPVSCPLPVHSYFHMILRLRRCIILGAFVAFWLHEEIPHLHPLPNPRVTTEVLVVQVCLAGSRLGCEFMGARVGGCETL